jgi:lipid-A-disaccharide synthase
LFRHSTFEIPHFAFWPLVTGHSSLPLMIIYFVAGEASADNHGAALMRALHHADPNLRFVGRGGPQMKALADPNFRNWIEQSGVLGLWEVIKHYGYFRKQFHETLREIETGRPDAVVLIDYPGFNLRLARGLRKKSPTQKIIYYISPQVWAWNRGRIKKMARWLDLMLCIFPFEADLYNESGLRTIFVGHPMIERLSARKSDVACDPNLIGLFPGSRLREVRKIFPILIETMRELRRTKPNLRFEVAAASEDLAREMERLIDPQDRQAIEIKVGHTSEIMQRAFAGIVASGSATLEAAYFGMPFILIYKVSWITYLAGRLLVKVKYLGMPNVLAEREIVPEFIQHRAQPAAIAKSVSRLFEADVRKQMLAGFDDVREQLGGAGASERAARAMLAEIR